MNLCDTRKAGDIEKEAMAGAPDLACHKVLKTKVLHAAPG
jgi:hypothetical protein